MRYSDTAICAHNRSHTFNTNSVWTQIDELVQFRTSGGEEPHDGMYQYLTPGNKNLDPQYMEIQRGGRGGEERGGGGVLIFRSKYVLSALMISFQRSW